MCRCQAAFGHKRFHALQFINVHKLLWQVHYLECPSLTGPNPRLGCGVYGGNEVLRPPAAPQKWPKARAQDWQQLARCAWHLRDMASASASWERQGIKHLTMDLLVMDVSRDPFKVPRCTSSRRADRFRLEHGLRYKLVHAQDHSARSLTSFDPAFEVSGLAESAEDGHTTKV